MLAAMVGREGDGALTGVGQRQPTTNQIINKIK